MRGASIRYVAIAEGAKADFAPTLSVSTVDILDDVSILSQDGVAFQDVTNPCDLYSTLLDGGSEPLPTEATSEHYGIWSEQISDETGAFATPIVLTLTAEAKYASMGITLEFDEANNIYCNDINIKWYRGNSLLADKDFYPNSASYFCPCVVMAYNKVVISFRKTNMPHNRLRLRSIQYGATLIFGGDELTSVKLSNSISPISAEVPIGSCDFSLMSKRSYEYLFEEKQPLSVYLDDTLIATTYLKTAKRNSRRAWTIDSENCIGILEDTEFTGGIYVDASARALLDEIAERAGVAISLADNLKTATVTGYIPYTTCRQALMQICIGIGAVAFVTANGGVDVHELSDETTTSIPRTRIFQGMSFENNSAIGAVEVYAHSYVPSAETQDIYKAEDSGTGDGIVVVFSAPYHSLSIENGEFVESGANYAIINANEGCVLRGAKYDHTKILKRKLNPNLVSSVSGSIASVENATLVSAKNVDNVLEKCYNYYVNMKSTRLKIVEYKGDTLPNGDQYVKTNVGDKIVTETEYLGDISGRIVEQKFALNSNVIVKDTTLQ